MRLRITVGVLLLGFVAPGLPCALCSQVSDSYRRIAEYEYRAARAGGLRAGAARGAAEGMKQAAHRRYRYPPGHTGGGCATTPPAQPIISECGYFYWNGYARDWQPLPPLRGDHGAGSNAPLRARR